MKNLMILPFLFLGCQSLVEIRDQVSDRIEKRQIKTTQITIEEKIEELQNQINKLLKLEPQIDKIQDQLNIINQKITTPPAEKPESLKKEIDPQPKVKKSNDPLMDFLNE